MNVDFEAKTATVTMAPGKNLTSEQCDAAFGGTSYKVAKFETVSG